MNTTAQAQTPNMPVAREDRSIIKLLQDPRTVQKFNALVPRHLNPERLLRTMLIGINQNPSFLQANPLTLLGACMFFAAIGLEPNTPMGHGYLIPFKKRKKVNGQWTDEVQIQSIIGYRGYIDLARRTSQLVNIHADVVYGAGAGQPADEFSFEYGSNQHLRHRPMGVRGDRPALWGYAHATLKDGEAFEVLPDAEVLKARDNSEGYRAALAAKTEAEAKQADAWKMKTYTSNPWVAHEHAMKAKTMVRRLAKWLPMSVEFQNAVHVDSLAEVGKIDYAAIAAKPEALAEGDITAFEVQAEGPPPAERGGPAPDKPVKAEGVKITVVKPEIKTEPGPEPGASGTGETASGIVSTGGTPAARTEGEPGPDAPVTDGGGRRGRRAANKPSLFTE